MPLNRVTSGRKNKLEALGQHRRASRSRVKTRSPGYPPGSHQHNHQGDRETDPFDPAFGNDVPIPITPHGHHLGLAPSASLTPATLLGPVQFRSPSAGIVVWIFRSQVHRVLTRMRTIVPVPSELILTLWKWPYPTWFCVFGIVSASSCSRIALIVIVRLASIVIDTHHAPCALRISAS
jgi:hypothetical protein